MAHITDVLRKRVLTEKTMKLMQEENKYTFDVALSSNKTEIKQAVEAMFNVKVTSVNTINVTPKTKRVRYYVGKTARRKKAFVGLAGGGGIGGGGGGGGGGRAIEMHSISDI